jgi:hypothetical protein
MKTTIDLPDDLLIEAKKFAADKRVTLRSLIERGLRQQIAAGRDRTGSKRKVRWVTVSGNLPGGTAIAGRESLREYWSDGSD